MQSKIARRAGWSHQGEPACLAAGGQSGDASIQRGKARNAIGSRGQSSDASVQGERHATPLAAGGQSSDATVQGERHATPLTAGGQSGDASVQGEIHATPLAAGGESGDASVQGEDMQRRWRRSTEYSHAKVHRGPFWIAGSAVHTAIIAIKAPKRLRSPFDTVSA